MILTSRLRLRPAQHKDLARLAAEFGRPEIRAWLPRVPDPYTVDDAQEWRLKSHAQIEEGTGLPLLVARRDDDLLVGGVALNEIDRAACAADMGYWIAPNEQGQGYAAEAAAALLAHAFAVVGLDRVWALVRPDNAASARVLARVGMSCAGNRVKDGDILYDCFEISREDHDRSRR